MNVENLVENYKTIVVVGSGGVGKTTTAAALGLRMAEKGLHVAVVTVDPAQRLATTLGFKGDSHNPVLVEKTNTGGSLSACLIQPKLIFDEFVRSCAPSAEAAERLIQNRLYQQLTTRLTGSQEFTSLEKLFELQNTGKFDLLILDTPPAQNAVDFLLAPDRILNLFNDAITKWFWGGSESSGLWRSLLGFGTAKAMKSLEFLTGASFIRELTDFFSSMRAFQVQLRKHAEGVHSVLKGTQTGFLLVTGFEAAKLSEAEDTTLDLKQMGFNLAGVIINRARPLWWDENASLSKSSLPEEWIQLYLQTAEYYRERLRQYREFAVVHHEKCQVYMVPHFLEDTIQGLPGLRTLASAIDPQVG